MPATWRRRLLRRGVHRVRGVGQECRGNEIGRRRGRGMPMRRLLRRGDGPVIGPRRGLGAGRLGLVLLVISVRVMALQGFNPFLYFQF